MLYKFGKQVLRVNQLYYNGEILTMNNTNEIVEAILIKDQVIEAVGTYEELRLKADKMTAVEEINLQGKTLMPGIIDAHLHFVMYGVTKINIDCKSLKIKNLTQLYEAIQKRVLETEEGHWVRVNGFNELSMDEKCYPLKEDLDVISTKHPIMITRTCGHIGVVNSLGLLMANIDEQTPNPQGGEIEKDQTGKLTGRLLETAYMQLNEQATYTIEELEEAMQLAQQDFFKVGITSIHEAGTFNADSFRQLQLASHERRVKLRIYAMIGSLNNCYDFTTTMMKSGVVTGTGDAHFKIGPAKLFVDGSSTGPTIATREPYTSNQNDYGMFIYTEDELYEVLGDAHAKGYQITVHAQGDAAIERYLNVIERALKENPRPHRHRIEHAGITTPDLQEKMKALQIIPIPNPPFPYEFGESYEKNYGERIDYMYPVADFLQHQLIVAAGSDAPITTVNPWVGIHTAINRHTTLGQPFGIRQSISLMEALKIYTYNGAYASFEEHQKGSLESGKLADYIILNQAITKTNRDELKNIEVVQTVIGGEVVYKV